MPNPPAAAPVPLLLVLLVGCGDSVPTAPVLGDSPPSLSMHGNGATTIFEEFAFPANIPVPAPCLGGTFLVTGTITGWDRIAITPSGHVHITEYLDFSGLTASSGGDTWVAASGAHEIWSVKLGPPGVSLNIVHQGHSRFIAEGGGPDVRFVHRIHQLLLPSGELQLDEVTFEALCSGKGG